MPPTCVSGKVIQISQTHERKQSMPIHTVFSIDGSLYQRWQADLLAYSHRKVNQPGPLTRLYSAWRIPPPFDGQTHHTVPYCPHPMTRDHYPPYNRILSLAHWIKHSP